MSSIRQNVIIGISDTTCRYAPRRAGGGWWVRRPIGSSESRTTGSARSRRGSSWEDRAGVVGLLQ